MGRLSLLQIASCREPHTNDILLKVILLAGAETSLKRFWKTVDLQKNEAGYAITLDKRPLKTPSGNKLNIPHDKQLVANLIANEWENQKTLLQPHALPMVCPPFVLYVTIR